MIDQTAQRTMQVPGAGIIPAGRPTIDYKEYPKMMTHPQYRPGKPSPEVKSPHGFTYHGIGEPVRFAPVLVKTQQDEEYHASLGYVSQGKCDPAAFDRAVGAGQIPEQVAHKPLEYPKWVLGKLCANAEEEQKVLGSPTPVVTVPALNESVSPDPLAHPAPWEDKSLDQLRIEDLEAKVDKLAGLMEKALGALEKMDGPPHDREYESTFHRVAAAAEAEVKRRTPAKKKRKPVVRTAQQKRDHSEAIKAGLARRKAQLTESPVAEQSDDAPIG
jgi:hypothetical protein